MFDKDTFRHLRRAALLAPLSALCILAPTLAPARAPMQDSQAPGFYRVKIGAFELTALSDGTAPMPVDELLSDPPEETRKTLTEAHLALPMDMSVNAYLLNTGARLVLIDAGGGEGMGQGLGKLAQSINAAGYRVDQVDDILLTHMHLDHLGGLTAQGRAVFPNAILHASQTEADFWLAPLRDKPTQNEPTQDKSGKAQADFGMAVAAALDPYITSGRFQPIQDRKGGQDHETIEIIAGIKAMPAPGHTPGNVIYLIESEGEKAVMLGDLVHVGPVQFQKPDVTFLFDDDPAKAAQTRHKIFDHAISQAALIGASHLPFPGLGHIGMDTPRYRWHPLNYSSQLN